MSKNIIFDLMTRYEGMFVFFFILDCSVFIKFLHATVSSFHHQNNVYKDDGRPPRAHSTAASIRAEVEHPFRVIKRQFGHVKVRYRSLAKNTAQLITLFALANLWMARNPWMRTMAQLRP